MEYGRLLLKGIAADASIEEIDNYLIMLYQIMYEKHLPVNGFIKTDEGVFIVAPVEILDMMQAVGKAYYHPFDFLEYVQNAEENDFWLVDPENYILMRYHR